MNLHLNHANLILKTDSYKYSHAWQYPPGTSEVSAYIESRKGGRFDEVTFFGLQMFLKDVLANRVTLADIDEAEPFIKAHGLPFNRAGWEIIAREHGGALPLAIEALPEGMTVPAGTPLVQIRNTDELRPGVPDRLSPLGGRGRADVVQRQVLGAPRP